MKLNRLITTIALALPLATAPIITSTTSVHAATEKQTNSHDYALASAVRYKHAKHYRTANSNPTVYQATFMADEPVVTLANGKATKVKSRSVTVDQKIVIKVSNQKLTKLLKSKSAYKAAKNVTYFHAKGLGWIKASALTK
ncbi:hypothetical protein [Nicoliella lavandulae]|uniref:Uncharacterized protein n=1 Tax=Nicoliella lavandulae TaxID=3082954 RepID=A0ABU8SLN8_9LACO